MYRDSYQHGMLSVFYSVGSKPLAIWETHVQDGTITRFLDDDIKSMVLEIRGTNVSTTYMVCPKGKHVLGIHMPFMVMIVKNLKKYFSFEVTILDDTGTRRRFRVSNFQSTSQVLPLSTAMPIGLNEGWNQIQFDLGKFTQRAYQRQFVEVQKVKINANIRLRRIYFARRLVPDDELPAEYKLYFPLASKGGRGRKSIDKAKLGGPEAPPPAVEAIVENTASKMSIKRPSQEKIPEEVEVIKAVSASKVAVEAPEGAQPSVEGEIPSAEGAEGARLEEKSPSVEKVASAGAVETAPAEGEAAGAPAGGQAARKTKVAEVAEVAPVDGKAPVDVAPQEEAPAENTAEAAPEPAEVTEAPPAEPEG